jgi:SOS response associated peptidase (SRAP)
MHRRQQPARRVAAEERQPGQSETIEYEDERGNGKPHSRSTATGWRPMPRTHVDESDFRAANKNHGLKAALCHRHEERQPIRHRRAWENWKDPTSGEWMRTFAIITTDASELVAQIHDRMPLIPRTHRLHPLAERRA